jgi:4-hydroxythreonine-4-phosphate dehydrogenase
MVKPIVGITLGDPCGIGPEVVVNALNRSGSYRSCNPLVIGNNTVVERTINLLDLRLKTRQIDSPKLTQGTHGIIDILDPQNLDPQEIALGEISKLAGKASVEWVLKAGELAQNGDIQAIATAPINKEAASLAGYKEVGHMELLQGLSKAPQVATMLMSGKLRVVHLTTHKSLRQACDFVTQDNVLQKILLTHTSFQTWGITKPRIGIAALNPHASDGGLLGTEEAHHIAPAVSMAQAQGIDAIGPIGADTIFH